MATLYVNADHEDRSDAWTRFEAADDPNFPFGTMQAAAMLAESGDIIRVEPSTLGQADPISIDPNMYYGIISDGLDLILPNADNSAGDTIVVEGHIVGDVKPKFRFLDLYGVNNWEFRDLQRGFDRGSEEDHGTVGGLQRCENLRLLRLTLTGGGWRTIGCDGNMVVEECSIFSPFEQGNFHFLNGVGFHLIGSDLSTDAVYPAQWQFLRCYFSEVQGEDCIQASLGPFDGGGSLEVRECIFDNIRIIEIGVSPIHTDCIQSLGCPEIRLIKNIFINCLQPFIGSDGRNGRITCIGNILDGVQNGLWTQGCDHFILIHNTIKSLYGGIAIGGRYNETHPDFVQRFTIVNNICSMIDLSGPVVIHEDSVINNNVVYNAPGLVTAWGNQLPGLPEFGGSARLVDVGLPEGNVSEWGHPSGALELANTPIESVGIGDGRSLIGLEITEDELEEASTDFFGNPYASPPDCGAMQGDPEVLISPAARPPYVLNVSPTGQDVSGVEDISCRFYPVPGLAMDPDTLIGSNVVITDNAGYSIPGIITLSELDENGYQTLTVNLVESIDPLVDGVLFPLVTYTVTLGNNIQDENGSGILGEQWQFRVAGPDNPAIRPVAYTGIRIAAFPNGSIGGFA